MRIRYNWGTKQLKEDIMTIEQMIINKMKTHYENPSREGLLELQGLNKKHPNEYIKAWKLA